MTEEELLGMPGAEEESPAEATKTLTQKAVVRVKSKAEVEVQRYKVQTGDTLEKIAQKFYGKASKWPVVFEANKDIIPEPSKIYPGQEIIIPALAEEKKEEIIQQTK
ncbi:MAG: LysM peptidoglycan-binding domain-containing protein [Candidatus Omnitrophica bacterium]|nr:LysM peptidoglycan-binding domain-containing protein [Candidatus Omnitrophota bacterium]